VIAARYRKRRAKSAAGFFLGRTVGHKRVLRLAFLTLPGFNSRLHGSCNAVACWLGETAKCEPRETKMDWSR